MAEEGRSVRDVSGPDRRDLAEMDWPVKQRLGSDVIGRRGKEREGWVGTGWARLNGRGVYYRGLEGIGEEMTG
jgi:hypothetical protein